MKSKMFAVFPELFTKTAMLSDAQFGQLMRAAFTYWNGGEGYTGEDALVSLSFAFLTDGLDRYAEKCAENKHNARKRWHSAREETNADACETDANACEVNANVYRKDAPNPNPNPNPIVSARTQASRTPPKAFVRPTEQEIRDFCTAKSLTVDAQRFFDYYESVGWKVGRKPMRDWHAAARSWAHREKEQQPPTALKDEYAHDGDPSLMDWEVYNLS